MTIKKNILLRWTLLGPQVGAMLGAPALWLISSPFDQWRSARSLEILSMSLLTAYVIGVPPAFITGLFHQHTQRSTLTHWMQRTCVVLVGVLVSPYLIWIALLIESQHRSIEWDGAMSTAIYLMTIGGLSTTVLLKINNENEVYK